MYNLVLNVDDRDAIDFVGYRYSHGNDLYNLLLECEWKIPESYYNDDIEWDGMHDIKFSIPEVIAWEIKEIVDDEEFGACWSKELIKKFTDFCDQIV